MNDLNEIFETCGIKLTEVQTEQFEKYSEFLIEYNKKVNLTAITAKQEVYQKHFLDSALLLTKVDIADGESLIDIGTGAGFPGVPLKILRPQMRLSLLDSLNKRLTFIEELMDMINIDGKLFHARAEDLGRETPFRDGYDYVTSRAVTRFPALAEYCIPFVKQDGIFAAYKGPGWQEEYDASKKAIKLLGGKLEDVIETTLPDGSQRTILLIKKIKETPDKYPRKGVKITKNPIL